MSIFDELEAASRAEIKKAPTDAESSRITTLGQELARLDKWIEDAERLVKERKARRLELQMKELPDAMDAIGQDKMGLPDDGVDIVVEDFCKAALPNPDEKDPPEIREQKLRLRKEGLSWLEENAEGLIKTTLEVELPKGSLPLAHQMRETILALFGRDATPESRAAHVADLETTFFAGRNEPGVDPSCALVDESVHWATLTSFVKEQLGKLKRGQPALSPPLEPLGAVVGRIAKLIKRKT